MFFFFNYSFGFPLTKTGLYAGEKRNFVCFVFTVSPPSPQWAWRVVCYTENREHPGRCRVRSRRRVALLYEMTKYRCCYNGNNNIVVMCVWISTAAVRRGCVATAGGGCARASCFRAFTNQQRWRDVTGASDTAGRRL